MVRVSIERLNELLFIDAAGVLRWRKFAGPKAQAGWEAAKGSQGMRINQAAYQKSHVVHALKHGEWPVGGFVDAVSGVVCGTAQGDASGGLSAERLRSVLAYDADSGVFRWLHRPSKCVRIGSIAGSKCSNGYLRIKVDGREFLAHRLAWLHVHGKWPVDVIDHVNGDKSDNRISNLRDVSHKTNSQNIKRATAANMSGILGAHRSGPNGFRSVIKGQDRYLNLGYFKTAEAASAAYIDAKRLLHAGCTI